MHALLQEFLLVFAASFVGFFFFDRFLKLVGVFSNDRTGRYFVLHVVCNGICSLVHWNDVVAVYLRPSLAFQANTSISGTAVIAALHSYHIVFYMPLDAVDWAHHLIMIVVMLPLAVLLNPGHLLGHGAFFASG